MATPGKCLGGLKKGRVRQSLGGCKGRLRSISWMAKERARLGQNIRGRKAPPRQCLAGRKMGPSLAKFGGRKKMSVPGNALKGERAVSCNDLEAEIYGPSG